MNIILRGIIIDIERHYDVERHYYYHIERHTEIRDNCEIQMMGGELHIYNYYELIYPKFCWCFRPVTICNIDRTILILN